MDIKNVNVEIVTTPVPAEELDPSDSFVLISGGDQNESKNEAQSLLSSLGNNKFKYLEPETNTFGKDIPSYKVLDNSNVTYITNSTFEYRSFVAVFDYAVNTYVNSNNPDHDVYATVIVHGLIHNSGEAHNSSTDADNKGTIMTNDGGTKVIENRNKVSVESKRKIKLRYGNNKASDNRMNNRQRKKLEPNYPSVGGSGNKRKDGSGKNGKKVDAPKQSYKSGRNTQGRSS